ncbi:MAG: hypothetical protein AAB767_03475 [Patescibacteria group bacterium]
MNIFEHMNKRIVLGFAGILIVLLGVFFYLLAGTDGSTEGPVTTLSASPLDTTLGRELLSALAELKSTKLDTSIFDDPVFASLQDFGVEIPAQPVGRRNPFAAFTGSVSGEKASFGVITSAPPSGTSTPKVTDAEEAAPKAPANPGGFDVE